VPEAGRRGSAWRAGLLARVPAVRRSLNEVVAYAAAWQDRTERSLAAARLDPARPLWLVLGDSTAQGVGASAYDRGYVGRVATLLGPRWLVVNLSRSGARTREVVDTQWPRSAAVLDGLTPALVSALVGANDLRHTPVEAHMQAAVDLARAMPAGGLVATLPRGWKETQARAVNAELGREAAAHGLRVADLWATTGPPYRGRYADGFHPNDRGYTSWVAAVAAALDLPPEG